MDSYPIYMSNFGIRPYEILSAPAQFVSRWQEEIAHVRDALAAGDRDNIAQVMTKNERIRVDLDANLAFLRSLHADAACASDMTLIAIGLWVLREKSRWHGNIRAGAKLIFGGRYLLQSFLERHGNATCLDLSVLINELTSAFEIEGDIYTFGGGRFGHRFWVGQNDNVLDPMYAWRRSGFFSSVDEFRDYLRNGRFPRYIKRTIDFDLVPEPAVVAR